MPVLELDKSNHQITNCKQPASRVPYPFQKRAFEALNQVKAAEPQGYAAMLVLPTGAGKTYTAAHWIIMNYIDKGIKVLWIAHRSELLKQAAEAFSDDTTEETLPSRASYESIVVSSQFGRSCNIEKNDLVIASRQSICSAGNMDYYIEWAKRCGPREKRKLLIVLDEAHHAAAVSYGYIISTMKEHIPHVDVLGLTATPYRTAKREQGSLKRIFPQGIAYHVDAATLIDAEILAAPRHIEVHTDVDMTKVFDVEELRRISKNDLTSLDDVSIQKISRNAERNHIIIDHYISNREKYGRTIVFAVDVANAIALSSLFNSVGVKSDYVVSSLQAGLNRSASTERTPQIIRAFREGKLDVLVNVNIATEGTDIPNIQTVFLARPTTSKILMTQMVGRGLRGPAAGGTKETNIVYFIDNWRGLVDFVSPSVLMDGNDMVSTQEKRSAQLKRYIHLAEIADLAVGLYQSSPSAFYNCSNIIPYGIIKCSYLRGDRDGEECEVSRDILVYDEAAEIYAHILGDISVLFDDLSRDYDDEYVHRVSSQLFFQYCERESGAFIGVSSDSIQAIILTSLAQKELPTIQKIEDRISLFDIVKACYSPELTEGDIEDTIHQIWDNNRKVREWYHKELYYGMMRVYFNRMKPVSGAESPTIKRLPKEKMDMHELQKYYPSYYEELRTYVIGNMKRDDEGYYYSDLQEEGAPPIRFRSLRAFEMDHVKEISAGGLTVKENLRMITRKQNLEKERQRRLSKA